MRNLSNYEIVKIAEGMPGGLQGFCKTWGWVQFGRALLTAAAATLQHEAAETQALTERDTAEEQRDQLVSELAGYLGLDFGEHSSANDPWQNAMDALDEKPTSQLAVWFGPMPESNGKVNWTAILYRKEANTFLSGVGDGYTLARSEYTDRVRYEADRVRFLIGELATPPWILDYDSELKAPADYKVKT